MAATDSSQPNKDLLNQNIELCVSHNFYNKAIANSRYNTKDVFTRFEPVKWTVKELIQHISIGKAYTVGLYKNAHRNKANFIQSCLFVLDIDEHTEFDTLLTHPVIKEYAFLIHPTPSWKDNHQKWRVLFLLEDAVTDVDEYEYMLAQFYDIFEGVITLDTNCIDGSRMFYGHETDIYHIQSNNIISHEMVEIWREAYQAHKQAEAASKTTYKGYDSLDSSDTQSVLKILGVTAINDRGVSNAIRCPIVTHEHDHVKPAAYYLEQKNLVHCHKCDKDYSLDSVMKKLLGNHQQKYVPHELDKFDATHTLNERYISDGLQDLLPLEHGAWLIKSPIGTGKTEFAKRIMSDLDQKARVLVITHRVALAKNLSQRLGITNYQDVEKDDLAHCQHLVLCINSYLRLGDKIPKYDLVVVDEIEQVIDHIYGDTFKTRADSISALQFLKSILCQKRVIALDAHLSSKSSKLVCDVRSDVNKVENTYQTNKGIMRCWNKRDALIAYAIQLLENGVKPVVFAVNSVDELKKLETLFTKKYGASQVQTIYGDNSSESSTIEFVNNIDDRLQDLKVCIYTPSMGTGVDIQAQVGAVIGLFNNVPLSAEDCLQMMGRCRQAKERHIWLQPSKPHRETNSNALYQTTLRKFRESNEVIRKYDNGAMRVELTEFDEEFYLLKSRIDAPINHSQNHFINHFCHLVEGHYQVVHVASDLDDEDLMSELIEAMRVSKAQIKEIVLTSPPMTPDKYELIHYTERTSIHTAGLLRYRIEHMYGQTINEAIYIHYQKDGFQKLRLFADVEYKTQTDMQKLELQRAELGLEPKGFHIRRKVMDEVLSIFRENGELTSNGVRKDQIEDLGNKFLKNNEQALKDYYGRTTQHKTNGFKVVQWMVRKVGLTLTKVRTRKEDMPVAYRLLPSQLAQMKLYTKQHQQHLEKDRS